jgi:biotin carboxylase
MHNVIYTCPNYTPNAVKFLDILTGLDGIRLHLISQEPLSWLPATVSQRVHGFRQISDVFQTSELIAAMRSIGDEQGEIYRLIGAVEPLQVHLAEAREALGIVGMGVEVALNFRDKYRMKSIFRANNLPCARAQEVKTIQDALDFVEKVGYPVVLKPIDGAGSLSTFKVHQMDELHAAMTQLDGRIAIAEEFVTGEEHSLDTFVCNGVPLFHSISHYAPNPLDAMRNPWIQWQVLVPMEVESPAYDDIREAGFAALKALGVKNGITHMEWFRRSDGSIAISEVAARPPGAQIMTLLSRAANFDAIAAWAKLMIFGEFEVPSRKYAVGGAYLRGQGTGRVKAIYGLEGIRQQYGHLICDEHIPAVGSVGTGHYEGEGYIIVRHPETEVVKTAIAAMVREIRVELG